MRPATALYLTAALLVLVAVATWLVTGSEGYTRWPDEKLAGSDAPLSAAEEDLLADIGFETEDERAAQPDVESRFAFGLVPGGLDPRHLPSVATAVALAVVISASAFVVRTCQGRGRVVPVSSPS